MPLLPDSDDIVPPETAGEGHGPGGGRRRSNGAAAALPSGPEPASVAVPPVGGPAARGRALAGRVTAAPARTIAFAVSLALLVAAVPTLGVVGLNMIRDSRAGRFVTRVTDPTAPGYEALVEPTPTAIVVEKNAADKPVGVVVLTLGGVNGGGGVMLLPLNTQVENAGPAVGRLQASYDNGGQARLVSQVSGLLRIGFSDILEINDQKWAALTARVAPIRFDNPDRISSSGLRLAAGPVALEPEQVGPYLAARNEDESELNRLNRQQTFWQAWLRAVAASRDPEVLPGETGSGIGLYIRTLARGPVTIGAVPMRPSARPNDVADERFLVDFDKLGRDVAAMVPFPVGSAPGARVTVRLLNGVSGRPIPRSLLNDLVQHGASIPTIGNDVRFGRKVTVFEYRDPSLRGKALFLRSGLQGRGRLRLNPRTSDTADVSVLLGADVISPSGRAVRAGG